MQHTQSLLHVRCAPLLSLSPMREQRVGVGCAGQCMYLGVGLSVGAQGSECCWKAIGQQQLPGVRTNHPGQPGCKQWRGRTNQESGLQAMEGSTSSSPGVGFTNPTKESLRRAPQVRSGHIVAPACWQKPSSDPHLHRPPQIGWSGVSGQGWQAGAFQADAVQAVGEGCTGQEPPARYCQYLLEVRQWHVRCQHGEQQWMHEGCRPQRVLVWDLGAETPEALRHYSIPPATCTGARLAWL